MFEHVPGFEHQPDQREIMRCAHWRAVVLDEPHRLARSCQPNPGLQHDGVWRVCVTLNAKRFGDRCGRTMDLNAAGMDAHLIDKAPRRVSIT
jgi:hypothetical protein